MMKLLGGEPAWLWMALSRASTAFSKVVKARAVLSAVGPNVDTSSSGPYDLPVLSRFAS
mgnify:CR=1 FL=1